MKILRLFTDMLTCNGSVVQAQIVDTVLPDGVCSIVTIAAAMVFGLLTKL
jgi:hypothetical protein